MADISKINPNGTEYNLKDAQARSDISTINGKIPTNASSDNKLATISDVSAAYKPKGNATLGTLPSLTADHLNWVYNMTEDFITTSDFAEGAGKSVKAGNEVGIIDISTTSTPNYKYTVLGGFIDTSGFQNKTLDTPITVDDTQKTTVETALQAINTLAAGVKSAVGSLSSLTTTVKTSIVAAINELVTSISTINGKIPSGASSSNKMATASDVNAKVGWTDAGSYIGKNLLRITANSTSQNGLTFIVNNDKSITVYGTATAETQLMLLKNLEDYFTLGKTYVLSGCTNPSSSNTYYLQYLDWNGSTPATVNKNGDTNITIFTPTGLYSALRILVTNGTNMGTQENPTVFYPMIREVGTPSGYQVPNIPDNTEVMTWDANKLVGARQLVKYPYQFESLEKNGITVTSHNSYVIVNGTASDNSDFPILKRYPVDSFHMYLPIGRYRLVSKTNKAFSVRDDNYCYLGTTYNGAFIPITGTGNMSFNISYEFEITENTQSDYKDATGAVLVAFYFMMLKNTVANNVRVDFMICPADDKDDSISSYIMSNYELTRNVRRYYKGDTIGTTETSHYGSYYGFVTSAGTELQFTIPLTKEFADTVVPSITIEKITARGINGYIIPIETTMQGNYKVYSCSKYGMNDQLIVSIKKDDDTAFDVTNNSVVVVTLVNYSITFS